MSQDEEMESPSLIGRKRSRDDNDNDCNANVNVNGNGNVNVNGSSKGDKDAQEKAQIKRGKTITNHESTATSNDSEQADLSSDAAATINGAGSVAVEAKVIYRDLRPMMNDGKSVNVNVNVHTTNMTMPHESKEETTNSLPTLLPMAPLLSNGTRIEIEMNGTNETIEQTKECDDDADEIEIVQEEPDPAELDDNVNMETHVEQRTSRMSNMKIVVGLFIMFIINTWATFLLLSMYFTAPAAVTMGPRHHPHIIPPSHTHYATRTRMRKAAKNRFYQVQKENNGDDNDKDSDGDGFSMIHNDRLSTMTLRQFLSHDDGFHLGMAPAFFGFYVYFGALTAFHEHVLTEEEVSKGKILFPVDLKKHKLQFEASTLVETTVAIVAERKFDADVMGTERFVDIDEDDAIHNNNAEGTATATAAVTNGQATKMPEPLLKSVAGASAGAMAAVLLAAGLNPRESAEFAGSMTVDKFWDFPGLGGLIKGNLFEEIMVRRIKRSGLSAPEGVDLDGLDLDYDYDTLENVKLEDSLIPVAVSGFDILTLEKKILTKGCIGKAARASSTFPGLFQPCKWKHDDDDMKSNDDDNANDKFHYLIDGGIMDYLGLAGLGHLRQDEKNKRVVNLVAGSFGFKVPMGPSQLPEGIHAKEVVSISIENAPQCGPWAMKNGPIAGQAAMNAIKGVLDVPMYHGNEEGHYVLHVDVTDFIVN